MPAAGSNAKDGNLLFLDTHEVIARFEAERQALAMMDHPHRQDPRWLPLLRKLGKAPEQLAAIEFDIVLPQVGASAP